MSIQTFKARTLPEALALVRRELGPDATVLHARHYNLGWWGRLTGSHQVEIAARLEERVESEFDYRSKYRDDFRNRVATQLDELEAKVEALQSCASAAPTHRLPTAYFSAYTWLIDADIQQDVARELVAEARDALGDAADRHTVRHYVRQTIEQAFQTSGPIQVGVGRGRLVALIGPTGVGKTTTIAKLAANFRLRERRRVGLITVDTYRVAAVEQLRTYADIIDLPMEVVSTPEELSQAMQRLGELDLILLDTAGRSPRDEVKVKELNTLLATVRPHEVHLVLSATVGAKNLLTTIENFRPVRPTSLLVTKLDEAISLGHLVSAARRSELPLSYLTHGQNVPDDIAVADAERLTQSVLAEPALEENVT
jgi:flagellar biosynthesis protein FlhF